MLDTLKQMDREIRRRDTDKEENGGVTRARKRRAGGEELEEVADIP